MLQNPQRQALTFLLMTVTLTIAARARAVDGVIEINQARASAGSITPGDAAGFPISISTGTFSNEPMSFRLTGPLFTSASGNVIEINSPHVTIDLNGFAIICLLPSCSGDAIVSSQNNITVINGTVRGFNRGVNLSGNGGRIENMRALNNTGDGLRGGSNCIVRNSVALSNGEDGIDTVVNCNVSGNTASSNTSDGIDTGAANLVTGNAASGNTGFGLNLRFTSTGYSNNVMSGNTGGTVSSGTPTGQNLCNASTTCP